MKIFNIRNDVEMQFYRLIQTTGTLKVFVIYSPAWRGVNTEFRPDYSGIWPLSSCELLKGRDSAASQGSLMELILSVQCLTVLLERHFFLFHSVGTHEVIAQPSQAPDTSAHLPENRNWLFLCMEEMVLKDLPTFLSCSSSSSSSNYSMTWKEFSASVLLHVGWKTL